MENEIWKDVIGYEGLYKVSSVGNVKNRFGRNLKPSFGRGYKRVVLFSKAKDTTKYVHRLVAESFLLNLEKKQTVNHINGNKLDNKIENLEWLTQKENIQHSVKIGTFKKKCKRIRKVLNKSTGVIYKNMNEAKKSENVTSIWRKLNGEQKNNTDLIFLE